MYKTKNCIMKKTFKPCDDVVHDHVGVHDHVVDNDVVVDDDDVHDHVVDDSNEYENKKIKARGIVRHHTVMPYCLGGSCAKYQGFENTYEFLKRDYSWVFDLLSETEVSEIIEKTIVKELS